jgi:hypothetical protein
MWKCEDVVDEPGGPGARFSEDRLGMYGSLAWVLDGASNVAKHRVTDDHSFFSDASWLVDRLDHALRTLAVETHLSLRQIVGEAIARTAEQAREEWSGVPDVPPSAALGVIRAEGDVMEYLVLADISIIVRTDDRIDELTDSRVDLFNTEARETMVALLDAGRTLQEARKEVNHLLAEARSHMNKPNGYWVASLDEHAVEKARCGEIPGVREVVLASDGFMRIVRPFGLISIDDLFAPDCRLSDLAQRVRRAERDDPEARAYPRWSVSDDLCAKRLRWLG